MYLTGPLLVEFSIHSIRSRFVPEVSEQPVTAVDDSSNPVAGVESTSCGNHVTTPWRVFALSMRSSVLGVLRTTTLKVLASTTEISPISEIEIVASIRVNPLSRAAWARR